MRKSGYISLIVFSLLLFAFSCKKSSGSAALYVPTASDATASATLTDLQNGRTLYVNNCNSCHGLYSPDDYSATQWRSIISNMGPRTGLSSANLVLVTKYVTRGN